jgi:hypothetical protein
MQQKNLATRYVDPKTVTIKEHVKEGQQVHFQYFRDGEFWYKTDAGLLFPISLQEAQRGRATFLASDKAIYYMRWIKRYVDACKTEAKVCQAGSAKLPAIISSL